MEASGFISCYFSVSDYGENDSIDSSKPDSSSRVTDIARKPKKVSKLKGGFIKSRSRVFKKCFDVPSVDTA